MYLVVDFIIPSIFFLCQYVPELLHVSHNETTELYSTSSLCPSFKTVVTKTPNITFNHGVSGVQNITSILDVTKGPSFSATRTDTVQVQYTMTTHGPNFSRNFKTVTYVTGTKDKTTTKTQTMFSIRGVTQVPNFSALNSATEVQNIQPTHGSHFERNKHSVRVMNKHVKNPNGAQNVFSTRGISEGPSTSTKHTATEVQYTTTHVPNFRRNKHSVRVINTHVKNPNGAQNVFSTRGISEGPSASTKHTATEVQYTTTHVPNFRRNFRTPRYATGKADTAASEVSNMFPTYGVAEAAKKPTYQMDTPIDRTAAIEANMKAIRDDLCNKESKKDGNESKRKTNRDYFIHILTDFTFSNKTSEQEWKKLFVRPLVAHLCKPKKWKLFGKLVVRLDEFNGNGDGKIDENEKNRIHSEMKTWTENGWKRKRKGKKDRKRKSRHQRHRNID